MHALPLEARRMNPVIPMKIEHLALNVADPAAMAAWYCRNLGFEIARRSDGASVAHFLRDPATGMMLEILSQTKGLERGPSLNRTSFGWSFDEEADGTSALLERSAPLSTHHSGQASPGMDELRQGHHLDPLCKRVAFGAGINDVR